MKFYHSRVCELLEKSFLPSPSGTASEPDRVLGSEIIGFDKNHPDEIAGVIVLICLSQALFVFNHGDHFFESLQGFIGFLLRDAEWGSQANG